MDRIDAELLHLLQLDCSQSLATLGRRVGLSISAVNGRLKKLRAQGVVRAYVALVDPVHVGYTTCAFVHVAVSGLRNEQPFVRAVVRMPEVEECHRTSGEFGFLLKIWSDSLEHLQDVLDRRIKTLPGVVRVQTFVVLSSPKDRVTGLTPKIPDAPD